MKSKYQHQRYGERLGVSVSTLRRWETEGRAPPSIRTEGGHRRYEVKDGSSSPSKRKTLVYARVSSADQKKDLASQKKVLEMYCAAKGWNYEIITDLGSGMNYRKKGLNRSSTLSQRDKWKDSFSRTKIACQDLAPSSSSVCAKRKTSK